MLTLIVQAVQQAPQVVPDVHIILQQPPPSGIPEWVKILISAATGAAFGIFGNVAMEYVRPMIQRMAITRQLMTELLTPLNLAAGMKSAFQELAHTSHTIEEKEAAVDSCRKMIRDYGAPRYDFYSTNQQATVFAMSWIGDLDMFYLFRKHFGWGAYADKPDPCDSMVLELESLLEIGMKMLRKNTPRLKLNSVTGRSVADYWIEEAIRNYRQKIETARLEQGGISFEDRSV